MREVSGTNRGEAGARCSLTSRLESPLDAHALIATATIEATVVALVGALLITLGLWLKARAEERFLMQELGPDVYRSYCRRVPMLIPFLPHR